MREGILNIFKTKLPYIGMTISTYKDSPILVYGGYSFCGTWGNKNILCELIEIKWQNIKTGELISNEDFIERFVNTN
jgi:hypothetical protein